MKFLHFADIHYGMENYGRTDPVTGLNSRLGDWDKSYQFLIDKAVKEDVDMVIFAGDAYKVRDPAPTYQRHFAEGIYKLSQAKIPVVMITGNHDIPNALGKATSLDIFRSLNVPRVLLADKPAFVEVDLSRHNPNKKGIVQLGLLPWLTKSQFLTDERRRVMASDQLALELTQKVGELIDGFSKQVNPKFPAILVAHGSVDGAIFGSERSIMLGSDIVIPPNNIIASKFDYFALGHIHKHQTVIEKPATVYAGSLERIDFGEASDDKGFVIGNITGRTSEVSGKKIGWQFVKVPAREFKVIKISKSKFQMSNQDPNQIILKQIRQTNIRHAVVKIFIECDEETAPQILENPIRQALQDGGANYIAGIQKEIASASRTKIEQGYSDEIISANPIDLLEKYLSAKKVNSTRIKKLQEYAAALLEQ